nr:hypothetical protein HMQNUMPU_HMQNUMPU_CDS_0008 [Microvirus sp.]
MVVEPFLRQRFIKIRRFRINIFFCLVVDIMLNFCYYNYAR